MAAEGEQVERPQWVPDGVDRERPGVAHDWHLGGARDSAAARGVAAREIVAWPPLPEALQVNRAFLRRTVRYCVGSGVTQLLDLGSGIPAVGTVHEMARRVDPTARTVYVDRDPVAVAHSQATLAGDDRAAAVWADLRQPAAILARPEVRRTLDFSRPVAVLLVGVLHFLPDAADNRRILATLRDAMAPGSLLVVSHARVGARPGEARRVAELYARPGHPVTLRTRTEIATLFDGFEMVEPGLVDAAWWRPDGAHDTAEAPDRVSGYGGVGRTS